MYKLYTFCRSTTAWRVRIAFNLKQITPQYEFVDLFKDEQLSPKYQSINPNMGVPTVKLPCGRLISESMAIIEYLNQVHQQPNCFFPGSALDRAQIRMFCELVNSGIHPYQNLRLLRQLQAQFKLDRAQWSKKMVKIGLAKIQTHLRNLPKEIQGKYSIGNHISAADIFLYPQVKSTRDRWGVDISAYPRLSQILAHLQTHPQFIQADPQNQPDFK